MKINNVEIEDLDLMDADVSEKFEKATNDLQAKEKVQNFQGKGLSEIIRTQCTLIFDFFNDVWGEGTDKKVFGNKVNYRTCEKAFKDVIDYAMKQKNEILKIAKVKMK
ncbi:AP endonuclease [Clostridium botulinum]|nr:AP endonuclease [Clostridium botulinum]NFO38878.1 AP endonuclease [Clostridium botulinum]NFP02318.1 AP endonuclease [Clostridium botulinum]